MKASIRSLGARLGTFESRIPPAGFPHEPVCDPGIAGMDPQRLRTVVQAFERQCARGAFPGGQLAVRRRGQLVIDLAVGTARGLRPIEREPRQAVRPQTRFAIFSATKPVVALAVAMLEERGALDVAAPVARYWEEFGRHGKRDITVLDVLTHRAGVLTPDLLRRPRDWADRDKVRAAIAEAEPTWPRGTLAYMPYEYGWILAEVVERAAGRPLDEFVAEEIAAPAGIPGLRFGAVAEEIPRLARAYWLGKRPTTVAGVELSRTFEETNNSAEVLTAFVPGAGVVCAAAELAAFYDVLVQGGVTHRGVRLVSAEMLRRYTSLHVAGFDRSNRVRLRVARGFLLGSRGPSVHGWWGTQRCFGHAGSFCTQGWADPDLGLAVAIVTNGNRGPLDSLLRFAPLGSALRRACRG